MVMIVFEMHAETIREAVLIVLSSRFPLTGKQIVLNVSKLITKPFSYQAVYKCLKLLQEKELLTKQKNQYALSPAYIQKILDYAENLNAVYVSNNKITITEKSQLLTTPEQEYYEPLHQKVIRFDKGVNPNPKNLGVISSS